MSLTPDKNHPTVGGPFDRRAFLTLLGSVGVGVSARARAFSTPLTGQKRVHRDKAKPAPAPPPHIGKAFMGFALRLGMQTVGSAAWFKKFPNSKILAELDRLTAPDRYSYADEPTVITGYGVTFFPLPSKEHHLQQVAFFDLGTGDLIHVLPWYTVFMLPMVDETLAKDDGLDAASRAAYLLPRYPRRLKTYNYSALPDRYRTAAGSIDFLYKGSASDGEVTYRIFVNRGGSLEELKKEGTLGISFGP